MTRAQRIEALLRDSLAPTHLEIENESRNHSVPAGSETHFKVVVVSEAFAGLGLVDRHRRVNEALRAELQAGLHALTIRAKTPSEFGTDATPFVSPPCLGGSKGDA